MNNTANNPGVLDHLLTIEAEAAALVKDAQTEADKKITEAEKQNRAAFELRYQEKAAEQEGEFQRELQKARERCQTELSDYGKKMESVTPDITHFTAVLESLFSGEK